MSTDHINRVVRDGPLLLDCSGDYSFTKSKNTYLVRVAGNEKTFDELQKAYWYIVERIEPTRKKLARLVDHNVLQHVIVDGKLVIELLEDWALALIEKMKPYEFEIHGNDMTVYCGIPIPTGIPLLVSLAGYKLKSIKVLPLYRASPKQE